MKRLLRLFGALFAVLVTLGFACLGGVALLLTTEVGQDFVGRQTQDAVSRVLGPGYEADLGEQAVALRPDGTLAVEWEGVTLTRADDEEASTSVRHIALALRLRPLLSGSLALGALEIEGARIDLAAIAGSAQPAPTPVESPRPTNSIIARTVTSGVAVLERQLEVLRSLQFETVAFSDIVVEGLPRISSEHADAVIHTAELSRDGDGSLRLDARFDIADIPLSVGGEADFSDAGSLQRLLLQSGRVSLGALVPPGPRDDPLDERPFATNAEIDFAVEVERDPETTELVSALLVGSGAGQVQVGRNHTDIEEARLRFTHRSGVDRLVLEPSPVRFDGIDFLASGTVEPDETRRGSTALNRLRFRFGSDAVHSTLAARPTTAAVWAEGTFSARRQRLDLDRLEVQTDDGVLTCSGVARYGSPVARTQLSFTSERIGAGAVKAFWPFNIGGGARRWVLAHLDDSGVASNARITLDMSASRMSSAFKPDGELRPGEFSVELDVSGAAVSLPADLPTIDGASAHISTVGAVTTVSVTDGTIGPDVRLSPSTVRLGKVTSVPDGATSVALDVVASGAARGILRVAAGKPIEAFRTFPMNVDGVAGSATVDASAELWFGPTLPRERQLQNWSVEAQLLDVTPPDPIEGQRFANLTGALSVEPGALRGDLSGSFNDLPADIDLQLPFGADAGIDNRIEIGLSVSEDDAHDLVPALADYLSGSTRATLVRADGALSASIDLTAATLRIPAIAWRKGPGVSARVEAIVARDGERTNLENINLTGEGFSATGQAMIDAGGLRRVSLDTLRLNPDDDVDLTLERTSDQLSITISGESFDARPLLEKLRAGGAEAGETGGPTIDVFASIDRLRGFDGQSVRGFNLNYASENGSTAAMSLAGTLGGTSLSGDLSPRGDMRSVRLQTQNLGALLGFAGVYPRMEGGAAELELQGTPAAGYRGRLRTRDFTLVDEPRLDSIVGSSSAQTSSLSQAVGQDLRTSRAYFDQAAAELSFRDGQLRVSNGIIRGPIFGSSFDGLLHDGQGRIDIAGSFMPAYGINRLFGAIPLVGQILGNGNEGGLLGITYRLNGAFVSPTLTVNPLSIIAPGVFRQIFEY